MKYSLSVLACLLATTTVSIKIEDCVDLENNKKSNLYTIVQGLEDNSSGYQKMDPKYISMKELEVFRRVSQSRENYFRYVKVLNKTKKETSVEKIEDEIGKQRRYPNGEQEILTQNCGFLENTYFIFSVGNNLKRYADEVVIDDTFEIKDLKIWQDKKDGSIQGNFGIINHKLENQQEYPSLFPTELRVFERNTEIAFILDKMDTINVDLKAIEILNLVKDAEVTPKIYKQMFDKENYFVFYEKFSSLYFEKVQKQKFTNNFRERMRLYLKMGLPLLTLHKNNLVHGNLNLDSFVALRTQNPEEFFDVRLMNFEFSGRQGQSIMKLDKSIFDKSSDRILKLDAEDDVFGFCVTILLIESQEDIIKHYFEGKFENTIKYAKSSKKRRQFYQKLFDDVFEPENSRFQIEFSRRSLNYFKKAIHLVLFNDYKKGPSEVKIGFILFLINHYLETDPV